MTDTVLTIWMKIFLWVSTCSIGHIKIFNNMQTISTFIVFNTNLIRIYMHLARVKPQLQRNCFNVLHGVSFMSIRPMLKKNFLFFFFLCLTGGKIKEFTKKNKKTGQTYHVWQKNHIIFYIWWISNLFLI